MERGVVVSCEKVVKAKNGFIIQGNMGAEEMNYLALYWDKIISPTNFVVRGYIHNEKDFVDCGLLKRKDYPVHVIDDTFPALQLVWEEKIVDELREQQKNIDWRLHQFGGDFALMCGRASDSVRIELANLLPVPTADIPVNEIMEFKARRRPELEALHSYSDELYFEIINSGDPCLSQARSMSKLKKAIADIDKLNNEGWKSPIKFNLQISNEIDLAKIKSLYAAIAGATITNHPVESLIVGGICTFLEGFVSLKVGKQNVRGKKGGNLVYLSRAKKEKII
ncbi:DUF6236 family protein [Providencia rettgeri]